MKIQIIEKPLTDLADYAAIPISFEVDHVLDVADRDGGLGGLLMSERPLETPYVKDYDAIESPVRWGERFDLSNWRMFVARGGDQNVGGAIVAVNSPELIMLEELDDLALLWDIRVSPPSRGTGIGSALFAAAEAWSRRQGCRRLKVETQNINVAACRFYARRGCRLGAINRFAYPGLPHESQLLWYKDLTGVAPAA